MVCADRLASNAATKRHTAARQSRGRKTDYCRPYLTLISFLFRIKMDPSLGDSTVEKRYVMSNVGVSLLLLSNKTIFRMSNENDWLRKALESLPAFSGREPDEQERILRQAWKI